MLRWQVWAALAAAILLAAVAALLLYLDKPLRTVAGFVSHTLCSGVFVSGLNSEQVYAQTVKPMPGLEDLGRLLRYEIARDRHEARYNLRQGVPGASL